MIIRTKSIKLEFVYLSIRKINKLKIKVMILTIIYVVGLVIFLSILKSRLIKGIK